MRPAVREPSALPATGDPEAHAPADEGTPRRRRFKSWHLRTRLLLTTLALLTGICGSVGVLGYVALERFLTGQLDGQLQEASNRAVRFGGHLPDESSEVPDPLDAPGQGAGTLNALVEDGQVTSAGLVSADGTKQELSAADLQFLSGFSTEQPATDRRLSAGNYRLMAANDPWHGGVIVTGLPLAAKKNILTSLSVTTAAVSLAGLTVTGLIGMVLIGRALRPLENLSSVATEVSELRLGEGEIALPTRMPAHAVSTDTEVGRVGHAFNKMLDNVGSALTARQRSETKIRRFVADASHELRTPLAAIRGYGELIRLTGNLDEEGRRSLGRIESEAKRMTALVEDLLLLARLDEVHARAQEDVDLVQLVVESVSDVRVTAPDYIWQVRLPEEPVVVPGHPGQLRQVLINLLTNAHRHTPRGTTVVAALALAPDGHSVITVTDDGLGIAPDFIDRIFSRFTKADETRSSTSGTTGLGLSIVEAIVAAHQGRIEVQSEPGHTKFTIHLPAKDLSLLN